jgi:hypothetical protein
MSESECKALVVKKLLKANCWQAEMRITRKAEDISAHDLCDATKFTSEYPQSEEIISSNFSRAGYEKKGIVCVI